MNAKQTVLLLLIFVMVTVVITELLFPSYIRAIIHNTANEPSSSAKLHTHKQVTDDNAFSDLSRNLTTSKTTNNNNTNEK
ncbi:MAG: hypothetical protein WCF23_23700 [Candidatus Nitrosopolaris sp.]